MSLRPHLVTPALVTLLAAGACASSASGGDPAATDPTTATASPAPTLLVNEDAQGFFEAIVSGRTGVNAQGCVTVGDRLLVAPEGSRLVDGTTLELTGYEPVEIGAAVQWGGGQEEVPRADADPGHVACTDSDADLVEVVAVAPGP